MLYIIILYIIFNTVWDFLYYNNNYYYNYYYR